MFSLLLPSSLPQAPQPVPGSGTHAIFPLPSSLFPSSSSNALTLFAPGAPAAQASDSAEEKAQAAVFLTGEAPLPEGAATSVHLYLPPSSAAAGQEEGGWRVIGVITNASPTFFFPLPPLPALTLPSPAPSIAAFPAHADAPLLGLVLEQAGTAAEIQGELGRLREVERGEEERKRTQVRAEVGWVAGRVAQHAYTYLSSYAPDSAPQTAPLLQKWLAAFERKLKLGGVEALRAGD